jgi:hypothetical protein
MHQTSPDSRGSAPQDPARPGYARRPTTWRRALIGLGVAAVALGVTAAPAAAGQASAGGAKPAAAAPSLAVAVSIPARRIPVTGVYVPPRVGSGDADFAGHGPNLLADARLNGIGSNRLSVTIFVDATETESDFTHARGTSPQFVIYVAPTGQCIVSVNRGTFDELQYRDTDHDVDVFGGQVVGSFVQQWRAVGDTAGNEAGTRTGAAISTFTFTATVQPC